MPREVVTPCPHVWRFVKTLYVAHKGRVHQSETLRYRFFCERCSLVELRSDPPEQNSHDPRGN